MKNFLVGSNDQRQNFCLQLCSCLTECISKFSHVNECICIACNTFCAIYIERKQEDCQHPTIARIKILLVLSSSSACAGSQHCNILKSCVSSLVRPGTSASCTAPSLDETNHFVVTWCALCCENSVSLSLASKSKLVFRWNQLPPNTNIAFLRVHDAFTSRKVLTRCRSASRVVVTAHGFGAGRRSHFCFALVSHSRLCS